MRRTRTKFKLSVVEQALYHELIAVCNNQKWPQIFKCSNYQLTSALYISNRTLIRARKKLVEAKLIYFQSAKGLGFENSYSFIVEMSVGRAPSPNNNVTPSPGAEAAGGDSAQMADYNKQKNNKTPPLSPKGAESESGKKKSYIELIPFNQIKPQLLADESWCEITAMQSGLSIRFLDIMPSQIDLFLQYIIATGEEHTVQTLSTAKRRFFWWWKTQGKKNYEENSENVDPVIW
ncbi:hypothetical protein [Bacteroides sp. 519]|uniref:DUF7833 domain-containing protein n=1 Tax=Bacteroides sp. 519 TaxID=2302937 RepID=UPI0013D03108|nr:hypothetical protein [Bacteroides sp. 519]